ncbi:alpha/beta fold hydrolase [Nonomuraea sp. B19D2]|uniref:alpha/beta fold hydrolase n=1 Tax=Nonomuraea sp. B19D2 TaxID=3159561 RepID=UPI0032DAC6C7
MGVGAGHAAADRVRPPGASADAHRFHDREHLGSPATTLTTHARDITAAIEYGGLTEVVLVAHSYGGAPATIAAGTIPERLARVVYLAALLPEQGKSLFDITPAPVVEAITRTGL